MANKTQLDYQERRMEDTAHHIRALHITFELSPCLSIITMRPNHRHASRIPPCPHRQHLILSNQYAGTEFNEDSSAEANV